MRACRVAAKRKTATGRLLLRGFLGAAGVAATTLRMTLQVGCSRPTAPALCRTAALRATYPPPALPLRGVVPRGTRPGKPPPDPPTPPAPSAPPARRLALPAVPHPSSSSGQYMSPAGAAYPASEPRLEPPSSLDHVAYSDVRRHRPHSGPAAVGNFCSASDGAIQKFSGAAGVAATTSSRYATIFASLRPTLPTRLHRLHRPRRPPGGSHSPPCRAPVARRASTCPPREPHILPPSRVLNLPRSNRLLQCEGHRPHSRTRRGWHHLQR